MNLNDKWQVGVLLSVNQTPEDSRIPSESRLPKNVAMADMESDSQSLPQDSEEIRQVERPNIDETQIVDGLDEEVSR